MQTKILKIDKENIEPEKILEAANVLKNGGLVAFPTETVYGLGANAFDNNAVSKIFVAKGRPLYNPLTVHISNRKILADIVENISETASVLMDNFWPGPLTLVVKKSAKISKTVSAGLTTVGIRMPSHPIALALIEASGFPIVAPSANVSGFQSPTDASQVIEYLLGKVDMIIDGGKTFIGIESTVLDITVNPPLILRYGAVTKSQIETVLNTNLSN